MFVKPQNPTEFVTPPPKRPKGGVNIPSEVAGISVRKGRAIGAVATGPVSSRRLPPGTGYSG